MKKLVLLLCLLPCGICAQTTSVIDSLQKVVAQKRSTQDKLGEAEALLALGNMYYDQKKDSLALEQIVAALKVVPADIAILKGKLLYRKGMLVYFLGQDFAQAFSLMDSAYILLKTSNDPSVLAPFLQSYGSMLNQQLDYKKGREVLLEAEQLCLKHPKIGTTDRLLNIYSNLLAGAFSSGDFDAGLSFARKGIEIGKNSQNFELLADLNYNNALILSSLGFEKDAEQYYLKALNLSKKAKVSSGIVSASIALGNYYCNSGQPKAGFEYLQKAKTIAIQSKDFYSIAIINQMESSGYVALKDYPKALAAIDSCIQYFEINKDSRLLQGVYYAKAGILRSLKNYDEAVFWAKKELDLAAITKNKFQVSNTFLLLSEIEKERHNFEQALAYHEQYTESKDSLYNQNLEAKLAEERTKQNIESEQEARRKAELESKLLASQNQLFSTAAGGLFLILLIGGYLFWQLQKTRKQLEFQNKELNQLNQTKDKFFGIIAHDLRNPLASFQGVGEQLHYYLEKADTAKLKKISDLITKSANNLSSLLDNLLSWALLNRGMIPHNPETLSLASEVFSNLEIHENAALAKNIRLESNIPPNIQVAADRNALQTILRNLIGNALKFTPPGGQVSIACEEKETEILVIVKDTGTGISAEAIQKLFNLDKRSEHGTAGEKGAGLGLILCKELVELNNGTLKVSSTEGIGSTFGFSLPRA